MIIQAIVNTAEICAQHGITQAVICPGSRSAPITLAFARHPKIQTYVIPDERSAGFFAMGLAQSANKPVVIICTSGTAVANIYPAIIESFYQQVPLLVLTADRPPEWVDQMDGQTIRQENIFQNHVVASYHFPVSTDHPDAIWQAEKMTSAAILKCNGAAISRGPVHVNIPIREPFYPSANEEFQYATSIKIIQAPKTENIIDHSAIITLIDDLKKYRRIMVVAGQTRISEDLKNSLNKILQKLNWVVLGDIISNVQHLDHAITNHDILLKSHKKTDSVKPDLVISFGQSVLSKNLKRFLRNDCEANHWSIGQDCGIDTFQSLTMSIAVTPEYFFGLVEEHLSGSEKSQIDFYDQWASRDKEAQIFKEKYFQQKEASEFHAVNEILGYLPDDCQLHLANSMPVRYANLIGLRKNINCTTWSNRGTNGIDGCISTAVGHAVNSDKMNIVFTGDMAFFYDRNGLWHNVVPDNLRIVILNNHGGGIFRLISGPKQLNELEEFFETKQKLNAANTAKDFGMNYFSVNSIGQLSDVFDRFFDPSIGASILEIESEARKNQEIYEEFMLRADKL